MPADPPNNRRQQTCARVRESLWRFLTAHRTFGAGPEPQADGWGGSGQNLGVRVCVIRAPRSETKLNCRSELRFVAQPTQFFTRSRRRRFATAPSLIQHSSTIY